jgi:hypothetical protein
LLLFAGGQDYLAFSATQYVPEALFKEVTLTEFEYNSLLAILGLQGAIPPFPVVPDSLDTDLPLPCTT